MPKEKDAKRIQDRRKRIQQLINAMHTSGYRTEYAIEHVAETYFLSKRTVEYDYYHKG